MANVRAACSIVLVFVCAMATAQDPVAREPDATPLAPQAVLTVPEFGNTTCPIMGKPASKSLYAKTPHGFVYVCCKPCIKKVQKDAEKAWATAYPVVKDATNAACPVTGKVVDAKVARVALQGFAVALCCAECEPKAKAASQVVLAKANDPKLVDLENRACPITGEETDANLIAVIDGSIVRFATRKARREAQKDPTAALARATELVKQQQAGTLKLVPHPAQQESDDDEGDDDAIPNAKATEAGGAKGGA